ncbi:effector-binding domain-containing protein [Flavobacterium croceum DSM 17960]|uniref:Effector-binding domain-containing protein n=1 Tax=Flavobacterium croceum DSM 17960 TaxID=1121886 RepID=A0A2S4N7B6_9FLAO|nr:hypothetical protein [Flavobacterium croceum]POS01612.1 effector-binding domain-containing protein [Flavobacterium croceum DSM 17960]
MRIIKYLLLMLLLFAIGLAVYIATQNASFDVHGSRLVKSQKNIVYGYLNDYSQWENFVSWNSIEKPLQFTINSKTGGIGAQCSWKGKHTGNVKTIYAKFNDSIAQTMVNNEQKSFVSWKVKDTTGGTLVMWHTKGKLDFMTKVIAFFKGGVSTSAGDVLDESIINLNRLIDKELNTFSINIKGVVTVPATFYIKKSMFSREKDIQKNIRVLLPKLEQYFSKNNFTANGKPFVQYTKFDRENDIIGLNICIPVKDSIAIMPGGEITSGERKPYQALSVILKGDYAHTQKAWNKGYTFIAKNKLVRNGSELITEVFQKGRKDTKNPADWETEILIPIYTKKKVYRKPVVSDSTKVSIPTPSVSTQIPTTPN